MRRPSVPTRWLVPLAVTLVTALVLAACGSAGLPNGGEEPDAGDGGQSAVGEGDGGSAPEPNSGRGDLDPGTDAYSIAIEQRIVKIGEVTLEVENVGASLGIVRAMATELGGYVGGSQAGTLDDRATLTLRIPAARFDEALARLHELDGELVAEATREQDVTGQVVDLQARIDNLRASEASYRELVARATDVDDILAVQTRLDQVRGEIEQLTAQLDALEGQAALSTLTVTLVPRPQPVTTQAAAWDPGAQLDRALAALVGIGQGILDGLIWFVIVWLPILLVLGIVALVALRGVLEVRRRMPAGVPAAAAHSASGDEATS